MAKVLHVVEALDRGAVESWLLRMLTHARRRGDQVDWTFYCTLAAPGARDCEARAMGARVVPSPVQIGDKLAFAKALRAELGLNLIVANGENAAAGAGLTGAIAAELLEAGVDALTLGDHVWDQRNFEAEIGSLERVCRPAKWFLSGVQKSATPAGSGVRQPWPSSMPQG